MWSLLLKRYQSKCTKPCGFRTNRTWPHLYSPSDAFNLTLTQHRLIHAQKQRCIQSQKTALNTQGAFYIYTQHRLKHTKQRRVIHTQRRFIHIASPFPYTYRRRIPTQKQHNIHKHNDALYGARSTAFYVYTQQRLIPTKTPFKHTLAHYTHRDAFYIYTKRCLIYSHNDAANTQIRLSYVSITPPYTDVTTTPYTYAGGRLLHTTPFT